MNIQTTKWIAKQVLAAICRHEELSEEVVADLGAKPFTDELRTHANATHKVHIFYLMNHSNWWMRFMGVNISRYTAVHDILNFVGANWKTEGHFDTKLSMIYLLMNHGMAPSLASSILDDLEVSKVEFLDCNRRYYKEKVWNSACSRLDDPKFAKGLVVYLLTMALLAETSPKDVGALPPEVQDLKSHPDVLVCNLADRVCVAWNRISR